MTASSRRPTSDSAAAADAAAAAIPATTPSGPTASAAILALPEVGDAAAEAASMARHARLARQAEIVPIDRLAATTAVVVGCGAIGSWAARFAAHLGVGRLVLVDHDVVEPANLALQGFAAADLGRPKARALADAVAAIDPQVVAVPRVGRFRPSALADGGGADRLAVLACVDSIDARRRIWEATRGRRALYVDGRMAALAWRVVTEDADDGYYATTLFAPEEAVPLRCTAKGTVCTAAAPALQMVTQLLLHLKGASTAEGSLARDVEGNLLSTTFEARHDAGPFPRPEPEPIAT